MPDETYPIELDRLGTQQALRVLAGCLLAAEARFGEMTAPTISAVVVGGEPTPPGIIVDPKFMSACNRRVFDEYADVPASVAFAAAAPYVAAALAALEEGGLLPPRLSDFSGAGA